MAQKALCLFCGAGGMVLGINNTDVDVVGAVDFSEPQINTVEKNLAVDTYNINLSSTDPHIFEEESKINDVDIITGGPPCQGFSLANINRKAEDKRNSLVFDYIDYVNYYQPDVFVMENVSGMKSIGDGSFISKIQKLFNADYNIKVFTFCASDFGVPQERERVFVVGVKKFIPTIEPDMSKATVKDAIYDLPDASKDTRLPNHTPINHKEKTVSKISNAEQGDTIYESYNQNQRLCWEKPSPTIVGSGWKYAHPSEDRAITNRERALLQSFPRDYEFVGNKSEVQQMIGNAVPPLMSYKIIDQLTP